MSLAVIRTSAHGQPRRLVAGLLLALLNLLVQPCLASLPAQPVAAAHCDHGGAPPGHASACPAMQATDCEMIGEFNFDSPQSVVPARTGTVLALLPLPVDCSRVRTHRAALERAASPATGPPLNILYCNLRN